MAHVRRLLDIVACTAAFGPRKSAPEQKPASPSSPDAPPPASPDAAKTPGRPAAALAPEAVEERSRCTRRRSWDSSTSSSPSPTSPRPSIVSASFVLLIHFCFLVFFWGSEDDEPVRVIFVIFLPLLFK